MTKWETEAILEVIRREELKGYLEIEPIISRIQISDPTDLKSYTLAAQLHIRPDGILEINPETIIVFEVVDRADQRALGELLTDKFFIARDPKYKGKAINLCLIYKEMPDGFEDLFSAYGIITYKV